MESKEAEEDHEISVIDLWSSDFLFPLNTNNHIAVTTPESGLQALEFLGLLDDKQSTGNDHVPRSRSSDVHLKASQAIRCGEFDDSTDSRKAGKVQNFLHSVAPQSAANTHRADHLLRIPLLACCYYINPNPNLAKINTYINKKV
ncbi:hypothetical protein Pfo_015134 [Paulownia fortunei]|nr:hypothetical protein Pfo_015134 [Paulownia fortunei]